MSEQEPMAFEQNVENEVEEPEEVWDDDRPSRLRRFVAPAWFLLGVIVGVVGFAVYTAAIAKPNPVDSAALRTAARNGTLDAIATLSAGGSPAVANDSPETTTQSPATFAVRDANLIGNKNAAVTIIEFSDFQCPFCERFHQTVEPTLLKQYVDTGKVAFVYKHSAFLGQESVWAAQAAECAADQGKFWQFHDLLFAKQNGENQGTFTKDKLIGFATDAGLDMTKFEPCLNNDETLARVQADTQEGQQAGVRGTPTFFINGQPLVGAQPLETFQAAIDKALAAPQ